MLVISVSVYTVTVVREDLVVTVFVVVSGTPYQVASHSTGV